ncbi:MAG: CorA family divalent cation transporter [Lachnospira eligens]
MDLWINMVDPTSKELEQIAERFEIEPEDISSALDEEESSRISLEDGYTVILVDIPTPEVRHEKKMYTTIPLGIILKSEAIITVCKVDTPIINYFVRNKVKEFSTKKRCVLYIRCFSVQLLCIRLIFVLLIRKELR